jgi:moderate conductance mechanosensitive channel
MRPIVPPGFLFWLLLALGGVAPAFAPSAVLAQGGAAAASAAPAVTPQQAQQALDVLRDPQRRAEVLAVLETLSRAARAAAGQPAPPAAVAGQEETSAADSGPPAIAAPAPAQAIPAPAPAPAPAQAPASPAEAAAAPAAAIPLAPDSLGAQVIVGLSDRLATLTEDIVEAARAISSFPLIVLWLVQLAGDPDRQGLLLDTLWRLAVVLGAGLAAEWLAARLLRPFQGRLAARAPAGPLAAAPEQEAGPDPAITPALTATARLEQAARQSDRIWRRARRMGIWLRRVPFGLASLALDLVPMLALLATGYALLAGGIAQQPTPRLVILAAMNAYMLYRLVSGAVCMLVSPGEPRLRLLPVGDAMADYVCRWARRAAGVGIFGYAILEAGLLFGLYRLAHGALVKLLMLVVAGFVVVVIMQQRQAIAALIRPHEGATGMAARLRAFIAPVWHIVAAIYVAALWVVLALDLPDGFTQLLRLSLSTVSVLVAARLVLVLGLGVIHRLLRQADDAAVQRAGVKGRLVTYQPVLGAVLRMAVGIAAVLGLLQVWGLPALSWLLQAELGGRLLRTLGSVALTVALAVGVWEGVNLAIERHLAGLAASAQVARSARLRTLLPMFRTTLLVAICIVVTMIVLAEIGLNIAPLLAGAGVLGVALGFGSQRLVQDVITGLFLLLENTMQVGDVVTLGGMSGTVENLSIRTIRLRALDGSMHIVPFSAVTTVTNMSRDFGYAVVDVSIGLNEDPERVGDVLRDVAATMRREDRWSPAISADLDVLGIDRFIDNALVLRTRIRTTPSQRWAVGRELNRRIKQRFDELAIQSPMTGARPSTPHALEEASG